MRWIAVLIVLCLPVSSGAMDAYNANGERIGQLLGFVGEYGLETAVVYIESLNKIIKMDTTGGFIYDINRTCNEGDFGAYYPTLNCTGRMFTSLRAGLMDQLLITTQFFSPYEFNHYVFKRVKNPNSITMRSKYIRDPHGNFSCRKTATWERHSGDFEIIQVELPFTYPPSQFFDKPVTLE